MSRFHNRNFELLEPYDAKVSRTVLRGEGSSNAPDLLDVIIDNSEENLQKFETSVPSNSTPSPSESEFVCGFLLSASASASAGTTYPAFMRSLRI